VQQVLARVTVNQPVMRDTFLLSLAVPPGFLAGATPGQFVEVRCGDSAAPLLRRPLGLHRFDAVAGRLDLLVRRAGEGTERLGRIREGEEVDVLGPLGQGFSLDRKARQVLLVGGGIGIAPLVALAEEASRQGLAVVLVDGAPSADLVYPSALLPREVEYVVVTEDGSAGDTGRATDRLTELLAWSDQVFACGPFAMYESLNGLAFKLRYPRTKIQVSLEERMACGVGACLGCAVFTRNGPKRVCKDGPVFKLREVF
jgi:dihydroorotate dehydrogenase electron transfer subunit